MALYLGNETEQKESSKGSIFDALKRLYEENDSNAHLVIDLRDKLKFALKPISSDESKYIALANDEQCQIARNILEQVDKMKVSNDELREIIARLDNGYG